MPALSPFTQEITMAHPILITGASGTIGRELVQQLKDAGATVIAGSSSGKTMAGVASRHVDFNEPASLATAFAGIDTLFLLLPLQADMVTLARNAVAAAKAAGVKHIVRSSGAGADPASPFAIARVQGEIDQLVIDSGIAYTLTRPNSFMQNYVNFYGGMLRGGALYLPQGEGKLSLIDARDIAAVNAAILLQPAAHADKVYTLTGGEALSNADVARFASEVTGKPVVYVPVSDEAGIAAMREMGMDAWTVEVMMSLNKVIQAGYAAGVSADVQAITGKAPRRFADFARESVAAWQ
jgi:uncharacterized protein YbjT (DUF2867 family)